MEFGSTDFSAENAALLIIDMQKAFVEPGAALCIAGAKTTVPMIAETVDAARSAGITIIWVNRVYAADGSDMEVPRRRDLEARGLLDVLAPDSKGINSIEDAEGLCPSDSDITIIKPRFSAFFDTDLDDMLRDMEIDTIVLTGTTTPNCIRQTAYDGISYNYETIVLEDCCSSQTPEIQRANMDDMARIGVTITDSRAFKEMLSI